MAGARNDVACSIIGTNRIVEGVTSKGSLLIGGSSPRINQGRWRVVCAGIQVDRKRYLEESVKRQEEADARRAEAEISCPVDCVNVVYNLQEFEAILERARQERDLVVVDFYNTACGACKYMLPQFVKLCKRGCSSDECIAEAEQESKIVFVKHNVLDDYDELTDLADFYSVTSVPLFAIFQDGSLVERFATRDKQRLERAVCQLLQGGESRTVLCTSIQSAVGLERQRGSWCHLLQKLVVGAVFVSSLNVRISVLKTEVLAVARFGAWCGRRRCILAAMATNVLV